MVWLSVTSQSSFQVEITFEDEDTGNVIRENVEVSLAGGNSLWMNIIEDYR